MTTVTLYCTGRGTHDRIDIYPYDGPLPVPDQWTPTLVVGRWRAWRRRPTPAFVFEMVCPSRRDGGCGRKPRPSDEWLRARINELGERGESEDDISLWDR